MIFLLVCQIKGLSKYWREATREHARHHFGHGLYRPFFSEACEFLDLKLDSQLEFYKY